MASKKQRRVSEIKSKKKKHYLRSLLLATIVVVIVGLLVFLFVTLFDTLFPPAGKGNMAKKKDKVEYTLFFSDANERFLVTEKRYLNKEASDEDQAKELVKALIEGSKTGNIATIPDKAEVKSIKIKDSGTAEINFNKNLIKYHPGGSTSEMATIYSLTDTLTTNIPKIKKVKLLLEGKELATIKGHIDTRHAFEFKDMKVPGEK